MSFPRHLRKKRPKRRPNPKPGRLDLRSVKLRSSALGRCRFVSALFSHRQLPLFASTGHRLLTTDHCSRATAHGSLTVRYCSEPPFRATGIAGQGLGSFSCPIPRSFVLSHNLPMTNTTSELAG